jgi:hypothetical protein
MAVLKALCGAVLALSWLIVPAFYMWSVNP